MGKSCSQPKFSRRPTGPRRVYSFGTSHRRGRRPLLPERDITIQPRAVFDNAARLLKPRYGRRRSYAGPDASVGGHLVCRCTTWEYVVESVARPAGATTETPPLPAPFSAILWSCFASARKALLGNDPAATC